MTVPKFVNSSLSINFNLTVFYFYIFQFDSYVATFYHDICFMSKYFCSEVVWISQNTGSKMLLCFAPDYGVCIPVFLIHHHKHLGLDTLIRSASRVTNARANASSVFQLDSFLLVCSGMISKGFGFVTFFASVKSSSVCILLFRLLFL